jgi:prepilin-type N-terminal cleavage/methylation domain-containing protein
MSDQSLIKKTAFTLVELLVVIAIIGLLSTIVLVSTSGLREQAEIAKTLTWAKSIDSLLGAEAVGIWSFDEGAENTCSDGKDACDISGWNNNGTMYNFASPQGYVDTTPSGHGSALSFDGVDDYVATVNFPFHNWTEFTINFWVYRDGGSSSPRIISQDTDSFAVTNVGGWVRNSVATYIPYSYSLTDKIWTLVTVTSRIDAGVIYINSYKNGAWSTGTSGVGTAYYTTAAILQIGRRTDGFHFGGLIDEVHIYNTALTASQIQSQYYAGLNKLQSKGLIDEREYQERLTLK